MTPVGLDRFLVRHIDHTGQIDIVAEVGAGHYLTPVSLDLRQVRSVDRAIAVDVCFEKAESDIRRPAAAIDVRDLEVTTCTSATPVSGTRISLPLKVGVPAVGRAADNGGLT